MKIRIFPCAFILLSAFLCALPYGFCEENDPTAYDALSLGDSIAVAHKNNIDIQIAEQEIRTARADIMAAEGAFLPTADVTASYLYSGQYFKLGNAASPGLKKDIGVFNGYQNDNKLDFTFNEVIFDGGARIANFKQSKLNLKVQEETVRAKKLFIEYETKRLYYGLLLAYETKRIAQNLYDQALAHYEDASKKYTQGTVSKFDVLQSKVQVSKVMPELVKAENSIELIKADFRKLLRLDMREPVNLKDNNLPYASVDIDEKGFLGRAFQYNPEMILKSLGIDVNKWAVEFAKAGYGPQINATFGYGFRSNRVATMFGYKHNNWNVGGSISVPIFDGFSTKSKVDQAKVKYDQARLEKENVADQVVVDITKGCLDMREAQAIIDYEKDGIEEAKDALRISNLRFDNGVGTNLDVLDSQVSLSQVEKNYVEGVYDYLMAKAFLDRTMGDEFLKEADNEKKD
ncbi:MAG: TolC family protein [Candidatus Omnitrophica bacterium]|nr:TolC family protein [Candidatus Omnitrophota bacterium]